MTDQKLKILAIDDDPITTRLLEKMLGDQYEISIASSGDTALDMIRQSDFDLILLDWMLPGMDGLSLLIALKADETTNDIPVLFVSGISEQKNIDEGINAGAAGYLIKPFGKDQVLESVKTALNQTAEPTVD